MDALRETEGNVSKLLDLLQDYVLERAISPGAAYQLRRTLTLFGPNRTIADLQPRTVSDWLLSLEATHARRTVAGHRGNLLAVWRWAAGRGLVSMPVGVRKCPRPKPRPVAWTADEFRRLLGACDRMPDPAWWRLVLETAYSTGLRRSDLWRVERDYLRDETLWLTQHKTGEPHACHVSHRAAEAILASDERFPLRPRDERRFYYEFSWLRRLANVRPGALQMVRRTGATQCEIRQAGSASRFLGHKTATMWQAYVDRSQLPNAPLSPPDIE